MRLDKVVIEGFRGYAEEITIEIDSLTAFVGKNDIGKSTVLEALDAFFNDQIDVDDFSTKLSNKFLRIGCVFSDLPAALSLDATYPTTLEDEYLLNDEGKFEVYKKWKATATKTELISVSCIASLPDVQNFELLLRKKNADLKKIVDDAGLEANKKINSDMRKAIYASVIEHENPHCVSREIVLDKPKSEMAEYEDSRRVWKLICERHLPVYTLFKSEQVRGDKEQAVRSPLDATLKMALKDAAAELDALSEQVLEKIRDTTGRTLARLQKDYPEIEKTLLPEYKYPSWAKAFDLNVLRGEDNIPLNKRGSGIRRLVVLAFFQAEAERKREARKKGEAGGSRVIYAVEEPETSQHPDFQKQIISALETLANDRDQVMVTTHVPALAELLPINSIRFIDKCSENKPRIRSSKDGSNVIEEAAKSLGVLPNAFPANNAIAQLAVWVEGETDVWVIDSLARKLKEADQLPSPLDPEAIYYVVGAGGDKLKAFVNGQYLSALGLPQFYLKDSDRLNADSNGHEFHPDVLNVVEDWEERRIGVPIAVFRTNKREIENYVHLNVIERLFGKPVVLFEEGDPIDLDFDDISKEGERFWTALQAEKRRCSAHLPEKIIKGMNVRHNKVKHVVCGHLIPEMTIDEIRERCSTTDTDETCEIDKWFYKMSELVQSVNR